MTNDSSIYNSYHYYIIVIIIKRWITFTYDIIIRSITIRIYYIILIAHTKGVNLRIDTQISSQLQFVKSNSKIWRYLLLCDSDLFPGRGEGELKLFQ